MNQGGGSLLEEQVLEFGRTCQEISNARLISFFFIFLIRFMFLCDFLFVYLVFFVRGSVSAVHAKWESSSDQWRWDRSGAKSSTEPTIFRPFCRFPISGKAN